LLVVPAPAGIHEHRAASRSAWMPAFAGMAREYFGVDQAVE
jgi:hypothetical protein